MKRINDMSSFRESPSEQITSGDSGIVSADLSPIDNHFGVIVSEVEGAPSSYDTDHSATGASTMKTDINGQLFPPSPTIGDATETAAGSSFSDRDNGTTLAGIAAYFSDDRGAPSSFDFLSATTTTSPSHSNPAPIVPSSTSTLSSSPYLPSSTIPVDESSSSVDDSFADYRDESNLWLPSDRTRQSLDLRAASSSSSTTCSGVTAAVSASLDHEVTTPRILMVEELGDPVKELMKRVAGEEEAAKRVTLKAHEVEQDRRGLIRLIATENFHAAVDLTRVLLQAFSTRATGSDRDENDEGDDEIGVVTTITPTTMQLWTTRLTLMMYKLRLYPAVEAELSAFGDLDRPDLYYEYHNHRHRRPSNNNGVQASSNTRVESSSSLSSSSLVPFSLRVLWAELPIFTGKAGETLDRLYQLLSIVESLIKNLETDIKMVDRKNGIPSDSRLSPDSTPDSTSPASSSSRQRALITWRRRRLQLLYSIANSLFLAKDVHSAVDILDRIVDREEETEPSRQSAVLSAAGRMLLQFGDLRDAANYFSRAEALLCNNEPLVESSKTEVDASGNRKLTRAEMDALRASHRGFLLIGAGKFRDAYEELQEAWRLSPNSPVAANNFACMNVYLGYLKRAVPIFGLEMTGSDEADKGVDDDVVAAKPMESAKQMVRHLHEGILFNLATLLEFEPSLALTRKKQILNLIAANKGDGFNPQCLKIA